MRKIRFISFALLVAFVICFSVSAGEVVLPFRQDTFAIQTRPTTPFGHDERFMLLGFVGSYQRVIYLGGVDQGALPDHSQIREAEIRIYNSFTGTSAQLDVDVAAVTTPWSEDDLTWQNQPASDLRNSGMFTMNDEEYFQREGRGSWYSIDVTEQLRSALQSGSFHGFVLQPRGSRGVEYEFAVREQGLEFAPRLIVRGPQLSDADYMTEEPPVIADEPSEPEGKLIALFPSEDTWVEDSSHNGDRNFGDGLGWTENGVEGDPALFLGFFGRDRRMVLLSRPEIPMEIQEDDLNAAYLRLYMVYSGSAREIPVSVRNITSRWRELTVTARNMPQFSRQSYGEAILSGSILWEERENGEGRWVSWEITDLVREWLRNPEGSEGILLYPEGRNGVDRQFDCNESDYDFGPRIDLYVDESVPLQASAPREETQPPRSGGGAEYPPDYTVTDGDIQRLIQAVREVDGSNPYIREHVVPESGVEHDLGTIESTEQDIRDLEEVIEILQQYDREALWVITRVGWYRPEVLLIFLRAGDNMADRIETMVHELTHAGSGRMSPFMQSSYFEGKAQRLGYSNARGYSFLLDNECLGFAYPAGLFPRSTVLQYIPESQRTGMESAYLTGSAGNQDLMTLLDEVNAYTRGMRNNLALAHMVPNNRDISWRLLKVVRFLELYLRHARTQVREDYERITSCPELAIIIHKMVYNVQVLIDESGSRFPVNRDLYALVFESEEFSEFAELLEATGAPELEDRPVSQLPATDRFRQRFILAY
ncbi:MAG: DNRLRE domain-containing protein [Spirochaetia bacterium]